MRKVLTVALREYGAAVKTKAFIITLVVMPLMVTGIGIVQLLLKDRVDLTDRRVAVIDYTGRLYDELAAAAERRNTHDVYGGRVSALQMPDLPGLPDELRGLLTFDEEDEELHFTGPMTEEQRQALLAACTGDRERRRIERLYEESQKQARPRFLLEQVDISAGAPTDIRKRLKARVDNQEIFAFLEIAPDVITGHAPSDDPPMVYYTARTTYQDLRNWLARPINRYIRGLRMEEAGLDDETVRRLRQYVMPRIRHVRSLDVTGEHIAGEETNEAADLLFPFGLMYLMFMVIMVGATPLVQSVVEEKMQRIAEVLIASITPFELMLGKLLGVVGVSLTITGVYLVGGYFAARHYGFDEYLPVRVLVWFVVFQALAIFMFGSLFVAIGASCSEMKETQSWLMPVMLLACLPLFVGMNVAREPTSGFATAVSFFPPATPMLTVLRLSAAPEISVWQPVLGVLVVLLTTLACVWAAGRIFRIGILMQGKGAKIGEMLRWALRG